MRWYDYNYVIPNRSGSKQTLFLVACLPVKLLSTQSSKFKLPGLRLPQSNSAINGKLTADACELSRPGVAVFMQGGIPAAFH
jgi:hypothetical protein